MRHSNVLASSLALFFVLCSLAHAQPQGVQNTPYPLAWIPDSIYKKTLFMTPNGAPGFCPPMVLDFLGAGNPNFEHPTSPDLMGGGEFVKVGITAELYYTRSTSGPNFIDPSKHMVYRMNQDMNAVTFLPPDVTDLNQLPALVRFGPDLVPGGGDDLDPNATLARFPRTIAFLEWARYKNLPLSFQLHGGITHGGYPLGTGLDSTELDGYIESLGKDQCMWDISDVSDPDDDNPATFEDAGSGWGWFSFATPTLADPALAATLGITLEYQSIAERNLKTALTELMQIASLPRYRGRLAGIALDPEIHLPSHESPNYRLTANDGSQVIRPFMEDYHPANILGFTKHLESRYGDTHPGVDSNGDGRTFWGDFQADYQASGGFGHNHQTMPATWARVDPPRYYPERESETRTDYWHEWINYNVLVIEAYLENLTLWAHEAGVPANRMFTHQTKAHSSYAASRARYNNQNWADDWMHIETSYGHAGISQYRPVGVLGIRNGGSHLYQNLLRRDEGWGSPEFNPYKIGGGAFATQAQMNIIAQAAIDSRAQVLWPHSWGSETNRIIDSTTMSWKTVEGANVFPGWTIHNFNPVAGTNILEADPAQSDWYVQSPVVDLDADDYTFIATKLLVRISNWPPLALIIFPKQKKLHFLCQALFGAIPPLNAKSGPPIAS